MSRRIMRAFKLNEISAVDRPAQIHARMTIMKRDNAAHRGSTPDHGDNDMSDIEKKVGELETQIADLTKKLETEAAKVVDLTKKLETADAALEKAKKDTDAAKGDEVLKVGETEIRKSEVGDKTFAAMKAQQDEVKKAREAAELIGLEKRAETELGHLPGETVAKAKVLKAIGGMGEEDRKALDAMLKAGEKAVSEAMKAKGVDNAGERGNDEEELEKLAKAYATEHKVDMVKARAAVMDTDEGRAIYKRMTEAAAKAAA